MTSQAMQSGRVLFALAIGAFGIGTTEFTPMGLLPVIAQGVDVSIPSAGMLITAYAIGVMVGAPVMTLLFSRFGKRAALMALMAIFTLGNLLSSLAPDYYTLLASRLVTSLNHGAFFGLGAVVAASVVPKEKQASAVATMFMGLTIANIGGVPAATWVGQQVGWRMAFAGTAALGLLAMAALWFALPKGERGSVPHVRRELAVIARPSVLLAMATTVLGAGAMFTLYTYVAPVLAELTGASDSFVTLGLVLIGVGFTLGNSLGAPGRLVAGRCSAHLPRSAGGNHAADATGTGQPYRRRPGLAGVGHVHLCRGATAADAGDDRGHRGAGAGLVDQRRCIQPG